MNANEFTKSSRRKAAQVASYINDVAPLMAARKTLRFIDGNFRAQGWQGATFQKWKPIKRKGTILVKTGRLRRGTNYTISSGQARIYNNTVYADVHNRGLTLIGKVKVRGFTRRRFMVDEISKPGARKPKFSRTKTGEHQVGAHTRQMKTTMPQRQFMPYDGHGSPVLDASTKREIERDLKKILTI